MWAHRALLWQLTKRDIAARYRGSMLGIVWSIINPLLLLSVYTFVFTVVFKARWGDAIATENDTLTFAFNLFIGLIFHGLLADILTRSPSLIRENKNYVTKVIFPLEILPVMAVGSALFQACINLLILFGAMLLFDFPIMVTAWLILPLMLIFSLFCLSVAYGLSAIGTYIRDLQQLMGLVATLFLFLSPVFYPIDALPLEWQGVIYLNPLTPAIEYARSLVFIGDIPPPGTLFFFLAAAGGLCAIGYGGFHLMRRGFADIL